MSLHIVTCNMLRLTCNINGTPMFLHPQCVQYRDGLIKKLDFENYLLSSNSRKEISLRKQRFEIYNTILVYSQQCMYDTELCTLCNLKVTGNENHYILIYQYFRHSD